MARSPGVERAIAILDLLALHPDRALSLTDIIHALKISRATCHSYLSSLVACRYVHRTDDKKYLLGPQLLSIGRVASRHASDLPTQSVTRPLVDTANSCSTV